MSFRHESVRIEGWEWRTDDISAIAPRMECPCGVEDSNRVQSNRRERRHSGTTEHIPEDTPKERIS
jgi:hypothetical protein